MLQVWQSNASNLHGLKDLHDWLHKTHLCYAVARQVSKVIAQAPCLGLKPNKYTPILIAHVQTEFGNLATDDVDKKALATY